MRVRSAETKFLIVSFIAVILLGIKTVASIVEDPQVDSKAFNRRQPSSVTKSEREIDLEKNLSASPVTASFHFNCLKNLQKEVTVKGSYLQIRGKDCTKAGQGDQLSIVNKSNGYTAAVFKTGRDEFQTDLIQLIDGQNQILIQFQNSSGKKFQHEVVVKSSHI